MAADCKSAALWSYGGSNPPLSTSSKIAGFRLQNADGESVHCGSNSVGRVTAFQAEPQSGRESGAADERPLAKYWKGKRTGVGIE